MCDFKVGDEVTLCRHTTWKQKRRILWFSRWVDGQPGPVFGEVYTITAISVAAAQVLEDTTQGDLPVLRFAEWGDWFSFRRFRKVQRRDLSAWLKTEAKNTDRLDKRAPAKERV